MTLLVLEIKVPELDRHVDAATLWRAVRALWPLFFSFFLTFMLTSMFWFWHHVSLHCMRRVDGVIVAINLGFLMGISLAPFSTAMLGSFTLHQPVSLAFYFGNQLALDVNGSALPQETKTRLIAEIVNHESTHGRCTKTFLKKIRKQTRPAG